MQLYDFPRSGNCYKIRLLLAMLGMKYERIHVDSSQGETLTEAFRALNPRGQIPVLRDGEVLLWDSQAILVYLAHRYGGGQWLPTDALGEAQVMQWLALAQNELLYGIARARVTLLFNRPFDLAACQAEGYQGLEALEHQLQQHDWLAADHPTLAEIACYPYVSLAHEGNISLDHYPAVRDWCQRFEALPGYRPLLDSQP